jgi:succinoglycan biosynthesis protein ExoM
VSVPHAVPLAHPVPRSVAPARVGVCVATYRRPGMLRALLLSLGALEFRKHPAEVFVVVVDNDAAQSARETVEGVRTELPLPLHYAVEAERNISGARNRGVQVALERGAEFVAFIDDDETATPAWLDELLDGVFRHGADAVGGAVHPVYDPEVPAWVVRGRFFDGPRFRTGTPRPYVATNNSLVSARLLRRTPRRFDPAFGRSGSGDSEFFMRVQRQGARLVWVDEAVVRERIPASRGRAGWVLRRAFRMGNGAVFCERALPPAIRRLSPRLIKAAIRTAGALLLVLPSLVLGRRGAVRALWSVAYGAGCFSALLGYRYIEYRSVHGD